MKKDWREDGGTATATVKIDARTLRMLGDWADGARGVEMVIVSTRKENELVLKRKGEVKVGEEQVILEVETPGVERHDVTTSLVVDGKAPYKLDERYDAVFWSESAYEKFVFPYYASVRTRDWEFMNGLLAAFKDPKTLFIPHLWPSISFAVSVLDGPSPFGIVQRDTKGEVRDLNEYVWERVGKHRHN